MVVEEVDNCQEPGSVRVQGHNRAASTSICIVDKVLQSPRQAFTIHTMLKLKIELQVIWLIVSPYEDTSCCVVMYHTCFWFCFVA